MTDNIKKPKDMTVAKAKGRPMLTWVGKKPLARVKAYPAQAIERFDATTGQPVTLQDVDWSDWPKDLPHGGLLYHGDNKDVLAHLLANGLRGKVKLIYIDPPFDSGADYVRKVQLRGAKGTVKIDGEDYTLGEQVQYSDIWANDNYLQFMYERLLLLRELLSEDGTLVLHCDCKKVHHLRCVLDETFGEDNFLNEVVWDYRRWPTPAPEFQKMHDNLLVYTKTKGRHTFNRQYMERTESTERRWKGKAIVAAHSEDGERIPSDYGQGESQGSPLNDVWYVPIVAPSGNERANYPTQKPIALIQKILVSLTDFGDVVLDSFVGSGTTVVTAKREGAGAEVRLVVEIQDVVSPTIMQRLNLDQGLFRAQITDWRAVVDCILIDTQYDGQVFNVALADVPARKQDLVSGRYELPAPPEGAKVAIKVIDMLGEELVVTLGV